MKLAVKHLLAAAVAGMVSFAAPAATTNLGNITAPFSTSYGGSFASAIGSFIDDFTFSLSPGGSFNAFAATIDLGNFLTINNLQARLFNSDGTVVQAWSSPISSTPGINGSVLVINPTTLLAGNYTLELKGDVIGSAGGSYSGVLNFAAPVPEPGTYALMFAGLGMIIAVARKRKAM